ncbi:MAG TPA: hypothetical protein VNF74_16240 [Terriglobales bacterium]|nr:hypothetical protein [Terriglobales bacterium]
MRFAKKIANNQSGGGAAVADPPAAVDALVEQEAAVDALEEKLKVAEAAVNEAESEYRRLAAAEALGAAPGPAAAARGRREEKRDTMNGLQVVLEQERATLARLREEHQTFLQRGAAAAHLAQFEALCREAAEAAHEAEKAWNTLGASLWRFDAAWAALHGEQFRPQHGGDVAAQLQDRLRKMRATAMNSGRRCTNHIEYGEILAIAPEGKKQ